MWFDFMLALLLAFFSTTPHGGVAISEALSKPGVCLREGVALVRAQPVQVGKKLRAPKKTRHVAPEFPELPHGTTVGGLWVGEALIDQQGKVAHVWTVAPSSSGPRSRR